MRYLILFLFCSTTYAAQVDLDLAVAKTHRDHWRQECLKLPAAKVKQCLKELNEAYAQTTKEIKARAAKEYKK